MNLLQMSRSGAVMILAMVVIRALVINRLPKRTFLALWGVVTARLLIPYSLPSAFSVYSLLERYAPAAEAVRDVPAVPFAAMAPAYNVTPVPGAADTAAAGVDPWLLVWLVGALACAGFFAMAYLKCRQEFQASFPVVNEYTKQWLNEHRIYRTIEIRQSGRISTPLTYGIFRPVILMPKNTDWSDADGLKYVLAHEYVHIRRFDAVTKLALTAALCVHWFNPAVWVMYVLANRDMELSCDEAVIRQFGDSTKPAYARTLIRMEEARSGLAPLCNNFSKNAVEERIIAIMKIKKTSLVTLFAAAALVAGMTTAFATSAKTDGNLSNEDLDRRLDAADTVMQESTMTSYVDPKDGKTYYSFDGGKTFEPLTDEEYRARFFTPDVEWWTYEEYKEWLENEKIQLQDMIGERGWTSGRGEFVWTQEIVDESIAMYEEILENIGRGMLYSKTIDGEADTSLMMSMNPADISNGGGMIWPVDSNQITYAFGSWNKLGDGDTVEHSGIDIGVMEAGAPIYAAGAGTVKDTGYNAGNGNYVRLDHGDGMETFYAHCQSVLVKTGGAVALGQTIATVGSTGKSTGPHLHFEILVNGVQQNPESYYSKNDAPAASVGRESNTGLSGIAED